VTTMESMFCDADAFNQPLSSWNTSAVTDMEKMFWGAEAFAQPIGSWKISPLNGCLTSLMLHAASFLTLVSGYVGPGSYQASWICCYCGLEGHGSELLKLNTASALQPRSRSDAPRASPTLPAGQSSRPKRPHVRAVWSGAILHRRFLSRMPARWKAELLGQRGTLPLFVQF
jgi:surface protein